MALIVYPTIVGGLSATIGVLILPYVHTINIAIGNMINSFTELQPVLMCMLISMVFSFIIISPLSTVAIAIAIGITGLAAGSASIGISATEAVLLIGTSQVNRVAVPISIFWWRENDDAKYGEISNYYVTYFDYRSDFWCSG